MSPGTAMGSAQLNQSIYAVGEWELTFVPLFVSSIRARRVRGDQGGQCYQKLMSRGLKVFLD